VKYTNAHPADFIYVFMMDKVCRTELFLFRLHLFKHLVHHIDGLDFLAVDDFRVYLRGAHVGVSHQLAGGIKVSPHGHHHRSEGVAARVVGDFLFNTGLFHPLFENFIGGRA